MSTGTLGLVVTVTVSPLAGMKQSMPGGKVGVKLAGCSAGRVNAALTELLLDLALQELHLGRLPVHQQHVAGLGHADQLHDAFGVGVGAEGHVLHLQLHLQLGKGGWRRGVMFACVSFSSAAGTSTRNLPVQQAADHRLDLCILPSLVEASGCFWVSYRCSSLHLQLPLAVQDLVSDGSLNAVTRHDDLEEADVF